MSAGASTWVILLWGIAPALVLLCFVLAYKAWQHGHPALSLVLAAVALFVAVARWIWR